MCREHYQLWNIKSPFGHENIQRLERKGRNYYVRHWSSRYQQRLPLCRTWCGSNPNRWKHENVTQTLKESHIIKNSRCGMLCTSVSSWKGWWCPINCQNLQTVWSSFACRFCNRRLYSAIHWNGRQVQLQAMGFQSWWSDKHQCWYAQVRIQPKGKFSVDFQEFKYQKKPILFVCYMARRNLHFTNCHGYQKWRMFEFSMGVFVGFGSQGFQGVNQEDFRMQRQIGIRNKEQRWVGVNHWAGFIDNIIQMQEFQCISIFGHDGEEGIFRVEAVESRVTSHDNNATALPSDGCVDQGNQGERRGNEEEPQPVWDRKQGNVRNGGQDSRWEPDWRFCYSLHGSGLQV